MKLFFRKILQRYLKTVAFLFNSLRIFGIERKRKVLIYCSEPFHYHHIRPVVQRIQQDGKIAIFCLEHPRFSRNNVSEELLDRNLFISILRARFTNFDMTIFLAYGEPVWLPCKGIVAFAPHGDGMKSNYTGNDSLKSFDIVFATGNSMYTLQSKHVKKGAIVEKIGFIVTDFSRSSAFGKLPNIPRKFDNDLPVVLYAPSWGKKPGAIMMTDSLLVTLASQKEFNVILRPHPYLLNPKVCHGKNWTGVFEKCIGTNFILDIDYSKPIQDTMQFATVLLSDISSVIYEFLYLDRPIVVHVNDEILTAYEGKGAFSEIEKCVFTFSSSETAISTLKEAINKPEDHALERKVVLGEKYYNIGKASECAVECIYRHVGL